tara:strand:- start:39 stop:749 length:711 start_codon:yes stop_codon:yes gene_type:complete
MKSENPFETESKGHSWGVKHVVLGWLLGQCSVIATVILISSIGSQVDLEDPSLEITAILQSALWIGTLGIPVWLYLVKGVTWEDLGWKFKKSDALTGLFTGVATQIAGGLLYLPLLIFFDDLDVSKPAQELVDKATGKGVVLLVIVVVIGAPIVEEIFFRGLALKAFEKHMGNRTSIIVSAAFFAIAHLQIVQFPSLFLFGLVSAYLTRKYERLGKAIWAHVGFNAVAVFGLLLQS